VLVAGVLVAGSGAGAATPGLVAAVTGTVRPAARPRAQAVVDSGTGAGVVAGGLLVLAVPEAWRPAWVAFAVLAVLTTAAADRRSRWPTAAAGSPRAPLGELTRPLVAAASVLLLAVRPGSVAVAAVALAGFGCTFVVLSGVLIAWGAHRMPTAAPQAAAVLFIGLTVGQAAGALLLGAVADATRPPTAFGVAAGLLLAAVPAAERVRPPVAPGSRRR